jgi:hypothetical protein
VNLFSYDLFDPSLPNCTTGRVGLERAYIRTLKKHDRDKGLKCWGGYCDLESAAVAAHGLGAAARDGGKSSSRDVRDTRAKPSGHMQKVADSLERAKLGSTVAHEPPRASST